MLARLVPVALLVLLTATPAAAVIVLTESGSRIAGYLVRKTDSEVVVRIKLPDGTEKEERYDAAKVTVLEAVKPERLTALSPDAPRGYRDYAEELAAKKDDPEARDMAVRLFVIAARLDPDGLGASALVAAATVARTPTEERRLRALAYLIDPKHDRAALRDEARPVAPPPAPVDPAFKTFVAGLRAYRKGHYKEAATASQQAGVAKCFDQVPQFVTHAAFVRLCTQPADPKSPPDPTTDVVRTILRIELDTEATATPPPKDAKDRAAGSWQDAVSAQGRRAPPPLTVEGVTEFDPRACVFKDGRWNTPKAP